MQICMNRMEFIDHVHDHEILLNNERKSHEFMMERVRDSCQLNSN